MIKYLRVCWDTVQVDGEADMNVNFEEYRSWIQKYIKNNDTREINFQNDVVKRLLEKLYPDYDVICVDTKGCDSKRHDYYAYSGSYKDDKGKKKPATPDLLICQNWDWYNKDNNNITYIATVEVKSPYGSEAIYKKEFKDYFPHSRTQIEQHLAAKKINKVIYTDTLKWEFYEKTLDSHKDIMLVDRIRKGRGYTFMWKKDAEKEFQNLLEELKRFLLS